MRTELIRSQGSKYYVSGWTIGDYDFPYSRLRKRLWSFLGPYNGQLMILEAGVDGRNL